jgi:DNA-binding MarR family transcriptional regulator
MLRNCAYVKLRRRTDLGGTAVGSNKAANERLPDEIADAFFSLSHALRRTVDARCVGVGLSLARLKVLHVLIERGGVRIGELSDLLDVAARTMTSTVDGLARDGLVERQPDPGDGRATLVTITARGRGVYKDGAKLKNALVRDVFEALDSDERTQFLAALTRLSRAAAASGPAPQTPRDRA